MVANPGYQGSSFELLKLISDQIAEVLAPASEVSISAPTRTPVDQSVDFSLNIFDAEGVAIPSADITAGTVSIARLRGGVVTTIVSPTAASKIDGRVWYTYTFPNASWQVGDSFRVLWEGVEYVDGVDTVVVPTRVHWGSINSEADVASDVGVIKAEVQHAGYGLSALSTDLAAVDADLAVDIAGVSSQVATVDGVVDGIASALAVTDGVVDANYALLAHASHGLAALKALIDTLTTNVSTVDGKVITVDTVVDANKALLENATYGLAALKTLIDGVSTSVGTRAAPSDITSAHATTNALIQGLNNLSQAQAQTAAHNALNQAKPGSVTSGSLFDLMTDSEGDAWTRSFYSLIAFHKRLNSLEHRVRAYLSGERELLTNGSFEHYTTGVPPSWSLSGTGAGVGTCQLGAIFGSTPHKNYYARFQAANTTTYKVTQSFTVNHLGARHLVTGWVQAPNAVSTRTFIVRISNGTYDYNKSFSMGNAAIANTDGAVIYNRAWNRFEFMFTPQATGTWTLDIEIAGTAAEWYYLDGISVKVLDTGRLHDNLTKFARLAGSEAEMNSSTVTNTIRQDAPGEFRVLSGYFTDTNGTHYSVTWKAEGEENSGRFTFLVDDFPWVAGKGLLSPSKPLHASLGTVGGQRRELDFVIEEHDGVDNDIYWEIFVEYTGEVPYIV